MERRNVPVFLYVSDDKFSFIRNMADSPEELAIEIGKKPASVRKAFSRMRKKGVLKNGKYELTFLPAEDEDQQTECEEGRKTV